MAKQQQRPVVPKFGNWDGQNNVPYTIYFDEARKAKNGGKMINPNDPMEYPGMFPNSPQNVPEEPVGQREVRNTKLDSQSKGNGDMKKFTDGRLSNNNQRPGVPQFGNWDGKDNVPYTIYFEEARKAKIGGKMINPNDPMEYPGMFPYSPQGTPSRNVPEEPVGQREVRNTTLDSQSKGNGDMKKFTDGRLSNNNQRPGVPQFGNWDGKDNVPYTIYFEEARKAKIGGKMINPNDPMENPGMFPYSPQATPSRNVPEEPIDQRAIRPAAHDGQSRENGDTNKFTDSPLSNDNVRRQRGTGSTLQNRGGSGSGSGQPGRQNGGSVHSIDQSQLHPQFQAKQNEKPGGSPAWESKHSNGTSNATPGRSRLNPVSPAVKYPVKGAAVPRFGEWNENNPSAGNNYTLAFNQVRHAKNSGSPMVSNMSAEQNYAASLKQNDRSNYKWQSRWFRCFGK